MNSRRLFVTVYVLVLAASAVGAGAMFVDLQAQYRQLKQLETMNRQKLAEARAHLLEQQRNLERLKTDPEYVERAVRQKLKYAKPGEYIFRFPE